MIILKIIERQRDRLEENVEDTREKIIALKLRGLFWRLSENVTARTDVLIQEGGGGGRLTWKFIQVPVVFIVIKWTKGLCFVTNLGALWQTKIDSPTAKPSIEATCGLLKFDHFKRVTNSRNIVSVYTNICGAQSRSWHYTTNRKVAGFVPDEVIGVFNWPNPSSRIMALVSTQPLT
jgi:hypothetical protein